MFGLEVVKGNNHTLLVVKKFNFTILFSKIQFNDLLYSRNRFVTLEIESLIL